MADSHPVSKPKRRVARSWLHDPRNWPYAILGALMVVSLLSRIALLL